MENHMIKWYDKYSENISLIDVQHKNLIEIINKAGMVEKSSNSPKDVLKILDEMTEYALKHFETEERYMKEYNFPGYQSHSNEHIDFINTVLDYKNRAIYGDFQIASETHEYLVQWYVNHIQVTDKECINFFKNNGHI